MKFRDLNPAVDRKYLLLLAGMAWAAVGVLLVTYAITWLSEYHGNTIPYYVAGIGAGLIIYRFGFSRIASKNISRLVPLKSKRCVFSFVTWKSYLVIAFMMTLGITLRHSSIPKHYLSILYNGIGIGLFLSGLAYFKNSFLFFMRKHPVLQQEIM
ncbi:MAG: hypothetical protein U0X39_15075 [Bacteroidales bacterium]